MIRVASFERERPNVVPSFRIGLGVGEPFAIRRKGTRIDWALTLHKAFRGAGGIRADPKKSRLRILIGDVPAVRTPDREIVARGACEAKKVVSLQIENPKTGISGKQRHSQTFAIRRESQR